IYSLDLKNIIPSGGVTCLVAKATNDEVVLWHRRLGHVNLKNINKLVQGHLVRGLPSKTFKIDHSCLACNKGKQHRASCKKQKPASTPIEAHKSLGKDEEGEDVDVHTYRSMIGCLMYLTASRPDIMFAICLCARFQVTPKVSHLHAVKRIFSDYAGDNHDRRSTLGGCQYLRRRLVFWQCKKQTIVAISSTEAEYVAAASYCAQRFADLKREFARLKGCRCTYLSWTSFCVESTANPTQSTACLRKYCLDNKVLF
ncbi:uncharacterized mitochondrial protein-like protein, partial [Tanacetum coccineum]